MMETIRLGLDGTGVALTTFCLLVTIPMFFIKIKQKWARYCVRILGVYLLISPNTGIFKRPWSISYNQDTVEVHTLLQTYSFDLAETQVETFTYKKYSPIKRLNASDGLWGYFGICTCKKLGEFRMCASQNKDLVVLFTKDRVPFVMDRIEVFE